MIYLKQNRTASARQLFSTLLALDSHNPTLHYPFGLVLRQKGNRAQGDRELDTALQTGLPRRNNKPLGNCYQEINVLVQAGL